jgi:hypothetical protein
MTGGLFFVPSADMLEDLAPGAAEATGSPAPPPAGESGDGSLGIGSLRDQPR